MKLALKWYIIVSIVIGIIVTISATIGGLYCHFGSAFKGKVVNFFSNVGTGFKYSLKAFKKAFNSSWNPVRK